MVINLATGKIVDAGVIITKKALKSEKLSAAEDDGRSGLKINREIRRVIKKHKPRVFAQEGQGGSKSVNGAKGLARAQQACLDAIDAVTDSVSIFVTPQAVKKAACGNMAATKQEMEDAMRKLWGSACFDRLLIGYAKSTWENVFDAAAVAHAVWDHQAVAFARSWL